MPRALIISRPMTAGSPAHLSEVYSALPYTFSPDKNSFVYCGNYISVLEKFIVCPDGTFAVVCLNLNGAHLSEIY